ncbi:hypothetical protein HanXRQr2_Chr11g0487621 [Helianthus annuus]|uniref:Uncharacterized protein n=1 Tax=Helianthus annuus TaxID=4232 RepID=A0A9K3N093_HELAN|nr:hypothetical protein HanXRQr2_Chr11g0487621 [Helianthus annuus]KAJ0874901.1 hypothetical protein HanPSC8_Chr11g0469821 [Helianthus annuus]
MYGKFCHSCIQILTFFSKSKPFGKLIENLIGFSRLIPLFSSIDLFCNTDVARLSRHVTNSRPNTFESLSTMLQI